MKKLVLAIAACTLTAGSILAAAADNPESKKANATYQDKQEFMVDFPSAHHVQWTSVDGLDKAMFTRQHRRMNAYYDEDGNLIGTTHAATLNKIPAFAKKYITRNYPDYQIHQIIEFRDDRPVSDAYLWGDTENQNNYFVSLGNQQHEIILKVNPEGDVSYFRQLK